MLKPCRLWTGKQLFSLVVRPTKKKGAPGGGHCGALLGRGNGTLGGTLRSIFCQSVQPKRSRVLGRHDPVHEVQCLSLSLPLSLSTRSQCQTTNLSLERLRDDSGVVVECRASARAPSVEHKQGLHFFRRPPRLADAHLRARGTHCGKGVSRTIKASRESRVSLSLPVSDTRTLWSAVSTSPRTARLRALPSVFVKDTSFRHFFLLATEFNGILRQLRGQGHARDVHRDRDRRFQVEFWNTKCQRDGVGFWNDGCQRTQSRGPWEFVEKFFLFLVFLRPRLDHDSRWILRTS